MSKQKAKIDTMDLMRKRVAAIYLGDKVNRRTHVCLTKYGLVKTKTKEEKENARAIRQALQEMSSLCRVCGPYVFYTDATKKARIAIKLSDAILSFEAETREATLDYLMTKCATFMSRDTTSKLEDNRKSILSRYKNKWISAAVAVSDALEIDWQFNYQGLLQAIRMPKFDSGIIEYMTKVLRPDAASLALIGKGILAPSQTREEIVARIREIVASASTFDEALRDYYTNYGHIPLGGDISICGLYSEWLKTKGSVANIWTVFWKWADNYISPLPRYHACLFFANNSALVPTEGNQKLVQEVIAVACLDEEDKGQWYDQWVVRCVLARYYCEYIECRYPGVSGERIVTQAWWLANQVGAVYGDNAEAVKEFREGTVEPEGNLMNIVWQMVHLPTEPSTLRYGTLYLRSIWSLSLVAQLRPEVLAILFSTATEPQRKVIDAAVASNLVSLFPIKNAEDKAIYAFDNGCIETARAVVQLGYEDIGINMINAFIKNIEKVTSENGFKETMKHLSQGNADDQLWMGHVTRILANIDRAPKEFIWECLYDREWMKSVFDSLNIMCAHHFCEGLTEIQLRSRGKWNEQLPHIFATACEELRENNKKKQLLFAHTIISSLAADSASAIERLLKGKNRFDYQEDVEKWRLKIEHTFPLVPEWCRARLRATLASLHI